MTKKKKQVWPTLIAGFLSKKSLRGLIHACWGEIAAIEGGRGVAADRKAAKGRRGRRWSSREENIYIRILYI